MAVAAVTAGSVTAGTAAAGTAAAGTVTAGAVTAGAVTAGAGAPWPAGARAHLASPAGLGTLALDAFTRPLRAADAVAARRRSPQQIAWSLLKSHGWWAGEYTYLSRLWIRESGWNPHASNPSSGAYGIPQAVPGSKMASVGSDWRTSPRTQILWGMRYIKARYGTPYRAWRHELSYGWY